MGSRTSRAAAADRRLSDSDTEGRLRPPLMRSCIGGSSCERSECNPARASNDPRRDAPRDDGRRFAAAPHRLRPADRRCLRSVRRPARADETPPAAAPTGAALTAWAMQWFTEMMAGRTDRSQYAPAFAPQVTDEAVATMSHDLNKYGAAPLRAEIVQDQERRRADLRHREIRLPARRRDEPPVRLRRGGQDHRRRRRRHGGRLTMRIRLGSPRWGT